MKLARNIPVLLTGAFLLYACGKKEEAAPQATVAQPSDPLALGKEVYMGKGACFTCHGNEGKGDGPAGAALKPKPRNFAEAKWKYGTELEKVKNTIAKGSPGTSMAAYEGTLTPEEIDAVARYVLTLGGKPIQ
ncbi:MAG: c-type cytochrome [Leptospiraceae bacterium]|nr:c-type cytochrome [Leptospiraceae bacterium]MDW8306732.1 c-type cytochrome [Leptospiraceae bacterium]